MTSCIRLNPRRPQVISAVVRRHLSSDLFRLEILQTTHFQTVVLLDQIFLVNVYNSNYSRADVSQIFQNELLTHLDIWLKFLSNFRIAFLNNSISFDFHSAQSAQNKEKKTRFSTGFAVQLLIILLIQVKQIYTEVLMDAVAQLQPNQINKPLTVWQTSSHQHFHGSFIPYRLRKPRSNDATCKVVCYGQSIKSQLANI
jgi:hypothetical protein